MFTSTDFVALLRHMPGYTNQIAHVEELPARPARTATSAAALPPRLAAVLKQLAIPSLYTHQAAALDLARGGAHMGIVTATASGKTLCYQLPILEALLEDTQARALCLYPTKALAADQLRSFERLLDVLDAKPDQPTNGYSAPRWNAIRGQQPPRAATLDGDTARPRRDMIRQGTSIVLSNPDMLHRSLLPDHRRWAALFAQLRFVVIDEAHSYRGVFGSHVALIIRRLRRLCAQYGSAPQFICCSATSANPHDHLRALIGDEITVIDDDGAPQGPRTFVLWNPPVIEARGRQRAEQGTRRSTNVETAGISASLLASGIKTLTFARTRRGAELMLRYARQNLEGRNADHGVGLAAYRAGYTPEERRKLELAFLSGELLGLISTNALELGVDIGGVDAVVIGGFPGTVASTWQQAGRAGRAQKHSLAVMVAQDDPLDQFYMRHPKQFFSRSVEHARIALDNPYILSAQLRCAASELALHDADETWFGSTFIGLRDWMLRHGEMAVLDDGSGRAVFNGNNPAAQVNIRSADGDPIELRDADSGRVIEQMGATRAPFELYPGAIYLHQGDSYLVESLEPRQALARRALARRAQVNYYTQTREETSIRIERIRQQRKAGAAELFLGVVEVTRQVTGFRRKEHYSEALLSEHDLSLPPQTFRTIAVWWTVDDALCRMVMSHCDELVDALHAMEHACIGLLPLFAQCDRADIGGLSIDMHSETGRPTIFVYDGVPGGAGISEIGYEQAEKWWEQTRTLLLECPCLEGCPACIQSPKCGNGNQHLSKPGAGALASVLLEQPIPGRDLPRADQPVARNGSEAQSLLSDLRGRLERASSEPRGPRRAALIAALRYRIRVARTEIAPTAQAELAQIESMAERLA